MAPVAHMDGAYFAPDEVVDSLFDSGRIAFCYCDADGVSTEAADPNGSVRHIAGVMSENGRVLGMMPHPERNAERLLGDGGGRAVRGGSLWGL